MFVNRVNRRAHAHTNLVSVLLVTLVLTLAASGAAWNDDGGSGGPGNPSVQAPTFDPLTRIVTTYAGGADATAHLVDAFGLCAAEGTVCTVRLSPGTYSVRALALPIFTGAVLVQSDEVLLSGYFLPSAPVSARNVGIHLDPTGRPPATLAITY